MSYVKTKVWVGGEGYMHAFRYHPDSHDPESDDPLPLIIYRPGGGWAGADVADMENSRWWYTLGLNNASSDDHETFAVLVINTVSVGYNRLQVTGVAAWATGGATYAVNDLRSHLGRYWVCIRAHTSTGTGAADAPSAGGSWAGYWREAAPNETGWRQIADVLETTTGGMEEGVINCQEWVAWARYHAAEYGWDPDRVVLAGASAGGQLAGCAAFSEPLPYVKEGQIQGSRINAPMHESVPNAVVLSITPVDFRMWTAYGLLKGLFHEDLTDGEWNAKPNSYKDAMSPLRVLHRTKILLPTYLDYAPPGSGYHGDGTAGTSPAHHADNGWAMLGYQTGASGLGQTDCRFSEIVPGGGSYNLYENQTDSPTVLATLQDVCDEFFVWLNSVL